MLAPVCREGPRMFESARMRISLPPRKARSVGRSRGPAFVFAARNVPRMMLPADFSASWRDGKALRRKFSADKGGDRFVSIWRNAFSDEIANQGPLRGSIDQRTGEKSRRAQRNGPKCSVHEDVAR